MLLLFGLVGVMGLPSIWLCLSGVVLGWLLAKGLISGLCWLVGFCCCDLCCDWIV